MEQYQAEINLTESYLVRWNMTKEEFWKKLTLAESNMKDAIALLRLFNIEVNENSIGFIECFTEGKKDKELYYSAGAALSAYYNCYHIHEKLHKSMDLVAAYLMAMGKGKLKSKRPGFIKRRKHEIKYA